MKEGSVNVTPMIDIVMCMIVFFMMVAKIGVTGGKDESIEIPATILGKDMESYANTLTLNVRAKPGFDMPEVTAVVDGSMREPQPIAVLEPGPNPRKPLTELLKRLRYGPDGLLNTADDNTDFKVIIRGERDMEYFYLEPVLIACAEASVKNVNFNTRRVQETVIIGAAASAR
jgi:biopolymer transport protein ExbD